MKPLWWHWIGSPQQESCPGAGTGFAPSPRSGQSPQRKGQGHGADLPLELRRWQCACRDEGGRRAWPSRRLAQAQDQFHTPENGSRSDPDGLPGAHPLASPSTAASVLRWKQNSDFYRLMCNKNTAWKSLSWLCKQGYLPLALRMSS